MKRLLILLFITNIWANDFLDPPYNDLITPSISNYKENLPVRATKAFDYTTSVKSQISRGTCSIFSAIAILESMMIIKYNSPKEINLSEEFLEYLVVRYRTEDGSNSSRNFQAFKNYGVPSEKEYPYIGDSWVNNPWNPDAEHFCGHLSGDLKASCLIIHRDPRLLDQNDETLSDANSPFYDLEFLQARKSAKAFRDQYITYNDYWFSVYSTNEVKSYLSKGIPLTLGMRFYYGAWNHRMADPYGIERDMENWYQGIVGYPEVGSMDRKISPEYGAGHSIEVVGFDDEKIVTTKVLMEDGSYKTFTYKGVYYFKNSWGTESFGKDFKLGDKSYPGFGMITQKHAHEHGGFFKLPL